MAESETDVYTRMMFGEHAVHLPLNMILQETGGERRGAGVFQSLSDGWARLAREAGPHVLVMADAVIRPQIVIASDHLIGAGIGSIYRNGFDMHAWLRGGRIVYDARGLFTRERGRIITDLEAGKGAA